MLDSSTLKMSGKYQIFTLHLLCVGFYEGNAAPGSFPLCNHPLNKTIRVNTGENATVRVTFTEGSNIRSHWHDWGAVFAWWNAEGKELCSSSSIGHKKCAGD